MSELIRVAVVGCGHMGNHHARTVSNHPACDLVATVDTDMEKATQLADRYGSTARMSVPETVDAVIIATDTCTHYEVTAPLLERGHWCLVEKPLTPLVSTAQSLINDRLCVGQSERFNPAFRAIENLTPIYVEATRLAPATNRSMDVDVVFDLMIHDLDIVASWTTGDVESVTAVGASSVGRHLDTCHAIVRWTGGLTAHFVASRVALTSTRVIRAYEPRRCTVLDLAKGVAVQNNVVLSRHGDDRDALTAQLDDFVAAIRGVRPPRVSSARGAMAVMLAQRVSEAARQ